MKTVGKIDVFISVISGAVFAIAFMVPYGGIISWFVLVPFFLILEGKSPRAAFILGLLTGSSVNAVGTYWIIGTLTRFGGFPYVVSVLFHLLFSIYSGLYISLFAYLSSRFGLLGKEGLVSAILIAALWTSVEFFFPFLFPYGIANSQASFIPLIQVSDLFGIHSLSFLIVLVNITLARLVGALRIRRKKPLGEIFFSIGLLFLVIVYGIIKMDRIEQKILTSPKVRIGIVQANFDFFEKNEDNEETISKTHSDMSRKFNSADLIVWPETAVQAWIPDSENALVVNGRSLIPDIPGSYFLVGGLSFKIKELGADGTLTDEQVDKFNTAFLTDSSGRILGRYHKVKLLLFGEYLPFAKYVPALKKLSPASGDFTPGNELKLLEVKEKGLKIAPLICYEDIIPYFSRELVKKGANIIVNLTNDAWFGRSTAPYQHLLVSIPRAVETRRYLIRATNTGISAAIDPLGRVVARTDIFKRVTLEVEAGLMEGKTIYTKLGDVFPLGCLVSFVVYVFFSFLKGRDNIL